ncbi:MAG: hypothetical protein IPM48_08695 [Saprospiraceae bacterium]|nr:hypothetical protein [Saprospiraceae bacterium]
MKHIIAILSFSLCLISCGTGGSTIKGITALASRTDCKGPCGKTMPCEGKPLSIEIELRNRNVLQGGRTLFVRDPDNYDYTVKIEFAETVADSNFVGIMDSKYKRIRLKGIVSGYDVYVHETCTRSYIFSVKDAKDWKMLTE